MKYLYLDIEEEILKIGIKTILKDKYKIVEGLHLKIENKAYIEINDKEKIGANKINLYQNIRLASNSISKNKLLKSVQAKTLKEAVEKISVGENYTQKEIETYTQELQKVDRNLKQLKERDRQIIQGILLEKTNKEIAKKLYLSEKTIKNNITQIYKKMGIKSRQEIIKKFPKKVLTEKF